MRTFRLWLPALLWIGLILLATSDLLSFGNTGSLLRRVTGEADPWALNVVLRKLGHVGGYAILGILLFRAARGTWTAGPLLQLLALTAALSLGTATVDETLQSLRPHRRGAVEDVALDTSSALLAAAISARTRRHQR